MRQHTSGFVMPIAMMAGATGARTMVALSAAARTRAPQLARVATALSALELLGDKLPGIPNRTDLGPMLGRVAAGAFIGDPIARATDPDRLTGAVLGAAFAFVGAHYTFRLRRALTRALPAVAAGAVEDAAII